MFDAEVSGGPVSSANAPPALIQLMGSVLVQLRGDATRTAPCSK